MNFNSNDVFEMKSDMELIDATLNGRKIPIVYDDMIGSIWVYSSADRGGIVAVIRAKSLESAYEIMLDESPTISEEDVPEAYGYDSVEELNKVLEDGDYPELLEGYQYQANFSGTGIVYVGLNGEMLERYSKYHYNNGLKLKIYHLDNE